jgi:hypothetical protein
MKQDLKAQEEEVVYFEINQLLPIGFTFIVLGIAIAYGFSIMDDVKTDQCTYGADAYGTCTNSTGGTGGDLGMTTAYNATKQSEEAVAKIPAKLGLIVTVVIAAVILGILVRYLMVRYA